MCNRWKKSDITLISIGKIQIIIAAPKTGLNRKLSWNTLTCGAVLEITPRIISCPSVADVGRFHNILEIGEVGAQVKHAAKSVMGSSYAIDRRKEG